MIDKNKIKEFYDNTASKKARWIKRNQYYHNQLLRYYQLCVLEGSSILELGCGTGDLIGRLNPSYGVGVDVSEETINIAQKKYPNINFICQDVENFDTTEAFDYIIISGTLANVENIQNLFLKVYRIANPDTRIIIDHYNQLWSPILSMGEKIGLKSKDIVHNWLSIDDIQNFLYISGFQIVKRDFFLLFPKYIPLISFIFNKLIANLPIIRRFTLNQIVIARKFCPPDKADQLSVSVVYTVRDEEGNIEGLVTRTPQLAKHTELVFVEGHSKDRTIEKIQAMITKYPEKDIKLYKQSGIGQGDAFRLGFDKAQGDFICWLEADLTTPPEQIKLFWDTYISGMGEYINGSRFIYKMENQAMPLLNMMGNRFFGYLFTFLLGQRFTDTLCGFKAISKRNYDRIRKHIDYFGDVDPFGDFELIFNVIKNNLKVAEIPVHYQPREYGSSKAYGQTFTSFLKHAWLLLKMSWIAFIKIKLF